MRVIFTVLVIATATASVAIGCSLGEQGPAPNMEATVEAMAEATRQVEQAVGATVEAQVQATRQAQESNEEGGKEPDPTRVTPSPNQTKDQTPSSPAPDRTQVPQMPIVTWGDCDQLLRNQLVFQTGAINAERMQEVIRQIQIQRDDCTSDLWNPTVEDPTSRESETCLSLVDGIDPVHLPPGLLSPDGNGPRPTSGRDSFNNIIVYWSKNPAEKTHDRSKCWVYLSDLNTWKAGKDLQGDDAKIRRIDLMVGECIVFQDEEGELDAVPVKVTCEGEWTHRVLGSFTAQDLGHYPGKDLFGRSAFQNCDPKYTLFLHPLKKSWEAGDRKVTCLQDSYGLSVTNPSKLERMLTPAALKEGDCFNPAPESGGIQVELVDCSGKWELRILNTFMAKESKEYPGVLQMERESAENCDRRNTGLTHPTLETWSFGSRTIRCFQENLTREPGTPEILDRLVDPWKVNQGECFNFYETPDHFLAELIPCAWEWEFQAIHKVQVSEDGEYPGDEHMEQRAEQRCGIDSLFLLPEEPLWNLGYRNIICLSTRD